MTDPETLAILSDPEAMRQLAQSELEIEQGLGESEEQLSEAMQRRRRLPEERAGAPVKSADASRAGAGLSCSMNEAGVGSDRDLDREDNASELAKEAHRQSRAAAESPDAESDQAFVDSVSGWPEE